MGWVIALAGIGSLLPAGSEGKPKLQGQAQLDLMQVAEL
jgi:hypothetical protein